MLPESGRRLARQKERAIKTREVSARAFCEAFVNSEPSRRFILGTGDYGRSLAQTIPVAAFIDDFTRNTHVDGVPIVRMSDVPEDGLVVVASMLRPQTALQQVTAEGIRALDYFAFQRFSGLSVKPVGFWSDFEQDYAANAGQYLSLRNRLADEESKSTLDNIIQFRINGDLEAMAGYRFDPENQYFEPFLELSDEGETFLDVGSFDGQTSLAFAGRAPNFSHIYAFEPSPQNFKMVSKNLEHLGPDRVTVLSCGLGNSEETHRFSAHLGSSSRATPEGETSISIKTLDSLAVKNPTFIKMDIEGSEVPALQGALGTIREFAPRIAVSCYHKFDDFRRIPEIVDEAGVPYKIFLRHYTEGIDETVMFFIPENIKVK